MWQITPRGFEKQWKTHKLIIIIGNLLNYKPLSTGPLCSCLPLSSENLCVDNVYVFVNVCAQP